MHALIKASFLSPCIFLATVWLHRCTPKTACDDDAVVAQVIALIGESLAQSPDFYRTRLAMANNAAMADIRAGRGSDATARLQCQANYLLTYNGKQHPIPISYGVSASAESKNVSVHTAPSSARATLAKLVAHEAPIKNGIAEQRDPATGHVVKTQEFKDGVLVASKEWMSDGKTLISDIRWLDGKPNGWEKGRISYYSGEVVTDWVWQNGSLSGFKEHHEKNGRDRTDVKNGIQTRRIYERSNGIESLVMEETYRGYKREGIQRTYANGELTVETEYQNGKPVRSTDPSVLEEFDEDLAFEWCTNLIANEYRGDKDADGSIPDAIHADWEKQCSD
jgi:antitoxin component YwqK of YwqJK toxin-antitoxin module